MIGVIIGAIFGGVIGVMLLALVVVGNCDKTQTEEGSKYKEVEE